MENPYCSCELMEGRLWELCQRDGRLGVPSELLRGADGPAARAQEARADEDAVGESWLTAAIPMDNPYCSCKLMEARLWDQGPYYYVPKQVGHMAYSRNPSWRTRLQL